MFYAIFLVLKIPTALAKDLYTSIQQLCAGSLKKIKQGLLPAWVRGMGQDSFGG